MTMVAERRHMKAPQHHLSDDLMLDYAAGSLDEARSLFVATHLTLCPACRARADELDALGGVLLEDITPVAMKPDALDAMFARLDAANDDPRAQQQFAEQSGQEKTPVSGIVMPSPLRSYFGHDLEQVAWQKRGGGVSLAEVPGISDGSRAFMLRVDPERVIPQHTHDGNEYVMVLTGGYSDADGHFARGDVEIGDHTLEHSPVADAGEDCVCLVVTDGPLRFTGRAGWVLNIFAKM